ncbi:hypothetical protein ASG35_08515 [Burkholderia sp. Leaf177]|nr:hypothetical protein ASG35_08515 [Burkholderia sp. Leaf177]
MPVDLTPGGPPSPYPKRRFNLVSWIVIWAVFCSIGACVALLLWPASLPAASAKFWLFVVGMPNAAFLLVFGCARASFETAHLRALYRNQHRQNWLRNRISYAQTPLHVLTQTYLFPVDNEALAATIISEKNVLASQSPRASTGRVLHSRLPDIEPDVDYQHAQEENASAENTEGSDIAVVRDIGKSQTKPDGFSHVIANILAPLADTLRALSRSKSKYIPVARIIVVDADTASSRLKHVHDALSELDLAAIGCEVVAANDGLMLLDEWLDVGETRPLLVIAAEWYDVVPPVGSTEGGVAILFSRDSEIHLAADSLKTIGRLHRPVAINVQNAMGVTRELAMSALWGKTSASEVLHAWISGFDPDFDKRLASALKNASFEGLANLSAIHIPDRIIGHAGSAAPWLAIAAAIESGEEGPQLILNQSGTAQSAILYANPPPKHENRAETEEPQEPQ